MKAVTINLIKTAPIVIAATVAGIAMSVAPSLAGEVGVTNSYSTRCITNGKFRSTFSEITREAGNKSSVIFAAKVEKGGDLTTTNTYDNVGGSFAGTYSGVESGKVGVGILSVPYSGKESGTFEGTTSTPVLTETKTTGSQYVAVSGSLQTSNSTFDSVATVNGTNNYNYTGADYSHSVSAFSN